MAALLQTYTIVPRGRQTHNRININQALSICTKQRLFMKLSDIEERHGRRISQTTVASSSRPSYVIGIARKNDEKQLLHPLLQVEPLFAPADHDHDCKQHNPNPANNNSINGCRRPSDNFKRNKGWTDKEGEEECLTVAKLHVIAAAAADRAEMHSVLAQQRDGWNKLFHNAFTALTLTAVTLCGLNAQGNHLALALSSTLLYAASSGMMCVVNKIQPSQLAEEQRMAARLFRQINTDIHTTLAIHPRLRQHADSYVEKAYRGVLAVDKAYPLPLLPGMLDKFPKAVEPTVWWEFGQDDDDDHRDGDGPETEDMNGWSAELERDLKEVSNLLKSRDIPEFVGLSHKVLGANRVVAVAAPLLTAIAAAGSALAGMTSSPSAIVVGTLSGVLATVANTLSHGGQMGMVFEMYRNCAGYYHFLDSSIAHNLSHSPQRREQGELFHLKLALQLGRTPSSPLLSPSTVDDANSFAGRLF